MMRPWLWVFVLCGISSEASHRQSQEYRALVKQWLKVKQQLNTRIAELDGNDEDSVEPLLHKLSDPVLPPLPRFKPPPSFRQKKKQHALGPDVVEWEGAQQSQDTSTEGIKEADVLTFASDVSVDFPEILSKQAAVQGGDGRGSDRTNGKLEIRTSAGSNSQSAGRGNGSSSSTTLDSDASSAGTSSSDSKKYNLISHSSAQGESIPDRKVQPLLIDSLEADKLVAAEYIGDPPKTMLSSSISSPSASSLSDQEVPLRSSFAGSLSPSSFPHLLSSQPSPLSPATIVFTEKPLLSDTFSNEAKLLSSDSSTSLKDEQNKGASLPSYSSSASSSSSFYNNPSENGQETGTDTTTNKREEQNEEIEKELDKQEEETNNQQRRNPTLNNFDTEETQKQSQTLNKDSEGSREAVDKTATAESEPDQSIPKAGTNNAKDEKQQLEKDNNNNNNNLDGTNTGKDNDVDNADNNDFNDNSNKNKEDNSDVIIRREISPLQSSVVVPEATDRKDISSQHSKKRKNKSNNEDDSNEEQEEQQPHSKQTHTDYAANHKHFHIEPHYHKHTVKSINLYLHPHKMHEEQSEPATKLKVVNKNKKTPTRKPSKQPHKKDDERHERRKKKAEQDEPQKLYEGSKSDIHKHSPQHWQQQKQEQQQQQQQQKQKQEQQQQKQEQQQQQKQEQQQQQKQEQQQQQQQKQEQEQQQQQKQEQQQQQQQKQEQQQQKQEQQQQKQEQPAHEQQITTITASVQRVSPLDTPIQKQGRYEVSSTFPTSSPSDSSSALVFAVSVLKRLLVRLELSLPQPAEQTGQEQDTQQEQPAKQQPPNQELQFQPSDHQLQIQHQEGSFFVKPVIQMLPAQSSSIPTVLTDENFNNDIRVLRLLIRQAAERSLEAKHNIWSDGTNQPRHSLQPQQGPQHVSEASPSPLPVDDQIYARLEKLVDHLEFTKQQIPPAESSAPYQPPSSDTKAQLAAIHQLQQYQLALSQPPKSQSDNLLTAVAELRQLLTQAEDFPRFRSDTKAK